MTRTRRGRRHARTLPLALSALLALAVPLAMAGEWKGSVETIEGVPHVMNPPTGMEEPMKVVLQEEWRLGGDSDSDEDFFGVITRVRADDAGNLYILDSQLSEVKIYGEDGTFLDVIGREGEGPGEFRRPSDMFLTPDGLIAVMQTFPGRVVLLTPEGDPAGDLPLPTDEAGAPPFLLGINSFGENVAYAGWTQKIDAGEYEMNRFIAIMDMEGNELTRVHESRRQLDFAKVVFDENIWDTFDNRWDVSPDGKHIYAVTEHFPYQIDVYDTDGKLVRVIEREYEEVQRSAERKERVTSIWKAFTRQVPNSDYKIYDRERDIESLHPRADGSLWVLSSRGIDERPKGSIGVFDVFNKDGRFVRQVTLMGEANPRQDAYLFVGDRVYVLTGFLDAVMAAQGGGPEDEEMALDAEPMGIVAYTVDVPDMGM